MEYHWNWLKLQINAWRQTASTNERIFAWCTMPLYCDVFNLMDSYGLYIKLVLTEYFGMDLHEVCMLLCCHFNWYAAPYNIHSSVKHFRAMIFNEAAFVTLHQDPKWSMRTAQFPFWRKSMDYINNNNHFVWNIYTPNHIKIQSMPAKSLWVQGSTHTA